MSDLNRPRENRLRGKFKGFLDYIMGADRPNDERPGDSRFGGAPQLTGEGTSLVCLQCANSLAHILCFQEPQNVMQGAHSFIMRDSTFYVAQNVCIVTTALMLLIY